ncbi:hypothetical protein [Bradyrhizobium sp. 153]|uniref:hypothetical protein n=1 Tax=Bradyrhizobium sp. 153 TaxID=2782627 RepID=UPI001FF9619E|nr:hypothetical protein [Bradyrhizobium sp. 153]MCK1668668.1 hypothetical protein [Bradyrhizobium sp. 153]
MARESSLWTWLSKARLEFPDVLHMERVENMLGAGFPDVDGYLRPHGAFQLELKSTTRPARPTTPVRFALQKRDAQIKFLRTRWELGANAFFLLQVGEASDRVLYLAPGNVGDKLKAGILEAALAVECVNTGIFKHPFSRRDILKAVTTCRRNPSQN